MTENNTKNQWPLWEVFVRSGRGLSHVHAGSLHAPDATMALRNGRDLYTRRNEEPLSGWCPQKQLPLLTQIPKVDFSNQPLARTTAMRRTTKNLKEWPTYEFR